MKLGSGAFEGPYSFSSRFEKGKGTNPEELIGAAEAGCLLDGAFVEPGESRPSRKTHQHHCEGETGDGRWRTKDHHHRSKH